MLTFANLRFTFVSSSNAAVTSDHLEHTFADIVLRDCGDSGDVHQDNQRRYKITRYGLAWFPPLVGGDQAATLQL